MHISSSTMRSYCVGMRGIAIDGKLVGRYGTILLEDVRLFRTSVDVKQGLVNVEWDDQEQSLCSVGHEGKVELQLSDPGQEDGYRRVYVDDCPTLQSMLDGQLSLFCRGDGVLISLTKFEAWYGALSEEDRLSQSALKLQEALGVSGTVLDLMDSTTVKVKYSAEENLIIPTSIALLEMDSTHQKDPSHGSILAGSITPTKVSTSQLSDATLRNRVTYKSSVNRLMGSAGRFFLCFAGEQRTFVRRLKEVFAQRLRVCPDGDVFYDDEAIKPGVSIQSIVPKIKSYMCGILLITRCFLSKVYPLMEVKTFLELDTPLCVVFLEDPDLCRSCLDEGCASSEVVSLRSVVKPLLDSSANCIDVSFVFRDSPGQAAVAITDGARRCLADLWDCTAESTLAAMVKALPAEDLSVSNDNLFTVAKTFLSFSYPSPNLAVAFYNWTRAASLYNGEEQLKFLASSRAYGLLQNARKRTQALMEKFHQVFKLYPSFDELSDEYCSMVESFLESVKEDGFRQDMLDSWHLLFTTPTGDMRSEVFNSKQALMAYVNDYFQGLPSERRSVLMEVYKALVLSQVEVGQRRMIEDFLVHDPCAFLNSLYSDVRAKLDRYHEESAYLFEASVEDRSSQKFSVLLIYESPAQESFASDLYQHLRSSLNGKDQPIELFPLIAGSAVQNTATELHVFPTGTIPIVGVVLVDSTLLLNDDLLTCLETIPVNTRIIPLFLNDPDDLDDLLQGMENDESAGCVSLIATHLLNKKGLVKTPGMGNSDIFDLVTEATFESAKDEQLSRFSFLAYSMITQVLLCDIDHPSVQDRRRKLQARLEELKLEIGRQRLSPHGTCRLACDNILDVIVSRLQSVSKCLLLASEGDFGGDFIEYVRNWMAAHNVYFKKLYDLTTLMDLTK